MDECLNWSFGTFTAVGKCVCVRASYIDVYDSALCVGGQNRAVYSMYALFYAAIEPFISHCVCCILCYALLNQVFSHFCSRSDHPTCNEYLGANRKCRLRTKLSLWTRVCSIEFTENASHAEIWFCALRPLKNVWIDLLENRVIAVT